MLRLSYSIFERSYINDAKNHNSPIVPIFLFSNARFSCQLVLCGHYSSGSAFYIDNSSIIKRTQ